MIVRSAGSRASRRSCLALAAVLAHLPLALAALGQPAPAAEVLRLTNLERQKAGLLPLRWSAPLERAAQAHADAMARRDFFAHDDPLEHTSAADRISAAGYAWSQEAENVAAGDETPAAVVQGWMASPGHRANVLDPQLRELGVGHAFDPADTFPSAGRPYRHYWVQDFGTPRDDAPVSPAAGAPAAAVPPGPLRPALPAHPGLLDPLPRPTEPAFCSSRNWWIPSLLLPLLVVLLVAFLLWRWSRRNEIAWFNLWLSWRWPCRVLSLVTLFLALLVALLFGRELFAGLCQPTEAVYFWRMDGGATGIFLTNRGHEGDAIPFRQLNREGCVGCHSVSSASHRIVAVEGPLPPQGLILGLDGERVKTPEIDPIFSSWSPDGERLAFSNPEGDIEILDFRAGTVRPLAGASLPDVTEVMPSWSPDGRTIAFARSRSPVWLKGVGVEGPTDIYSVPAEGGAALPLSGASGDGFNYYPAYSPDGKWLAFTRHAGGHTTYGDEEAEIYLVPAHGGARERLTANDAADGAPLSRVSNSWPTWSRDGRWLAFNSKRQDPSFDIFVAAIDERGKSGPAQPLPGASSPGVFEHTPFWGEPLRLLPLWRRLLNLWPWLLPFLLLLPLRRWLCSGGLGGLIALPPLGRTPEGRPPVRFLDRWRGQPPEWTPSPTLVIGLGGSGRRVLTHLKKNLLDAAGEGGWRDEIQLLLLDTSPEEIVAGRAEPVQVAGVALDPDEQLILGTDLRELIHRLDLDPDGEPELGRWLPVEDYLRVHRLTDAEMDAHRTTHQRRPLGRALVHCDVRQGESSRLWRALKEAVARGAREGRARVMIVGSLAGGFGSAVLADVAYLVRRAAGGDDGQRAAVLTAFLVSDNAFAPLTRAPQLKLNGMAALRELGRFQLAHGRPFPMVYDRRSPDEALRGFIEWSLLDEVFLLDGQRPVHPLTLVPPDLGMFPLVADLITAFLDRGSRMVEEVRANLRNQAAAVQVESGEPVVSSLGAYTYRLPLRDLARGLYLRFAHDLLLLYLGGPEGGGRPVGLAPDACRDRYPEGLPAMADHFLRGTLHGERLGAGGGSLLLADLALGGEAVTPWRGLSGEQVAVQAEHFRQALVAVLLRQLNGRPEDPLTVARCGKLGYALAFVDELAAVLGRARERGSHLRPRLRGAMATGCERLLDLAARELAIVAAQRRQLEAGAQLLLGREAAPAGAGGLERGVLDELRERLAQERQWRESMRQVVVRRTFAEESFCDELYQTHLEPWLQTRGPEYLYWRAREGAGLELALALEGWEDSACGADAAGRQRLQSGLLDLAASLGRAVWSLRLDPQFDHEERGRWATGRLRSQAAAEAVAWAEPVTTVQVGKAQEQQPARYLWVNSTVASRDAFALEIGRQAKMREEVHLLSATDPYSASLITSLDILPLSALDCTLRLLAAYQDAHQLGLGPAQQDLRRLPETVQVFAAEQHALAFERRLVELREPPRLFHPLFVAGLEEPERARTFCLAYAQGWVRRGRVQERGEWRERYVLALPGGEREIPLTRGDRPHSLVALIVQALQSFALGRSPEGRLEHDRPGDEIAAQTAAALERCAAPEEALRRFLERRPTDLEGETRIGAGDFWSVARLVVSDELARVRPA